MHCTHVWKCWRKFISIQRIWKPKEISQIFINYSIVRRQDKVKWPWTSDLLSSKKGSARWHAFSVLLRMHPSCSTCEVSKNSPTWAVFVDYSIGVLIITIYFLNDLQLCSLQDREIFCCKKLRSKPVTKQYKSYCLDSIKSKHFKIIIYIFKDMIIKHSTIEMCSYKI